jgi:hypothetical protein
MVKKNWRYNSTPLRVFVIPDFFNHLNACPPGANNGNNYHMTGVRPEFFIGGGGGGAYHNTEYNFCEFKNYF